MKITLRAARVNAGMSQKIAAERIGVNPATLGKWEAQKGSPSIEQAQRLCNLYRVPISDIIFLPTELIIN